MNVKFYNNEFNGWQKYPDGPTVKVTATCKFTLCHAHLTIKNKNGLYHEIAKHCIWLDELKKLGFSG